MVDGRGDEGGQRIVERELGWNRGTIRKGQQELEHGIVCIDAYSSRGRKRSEEHLPNLLSDITAIVDGQSQADPQFRSNRLYTRLTATEVRRQLIAQKGYSDNELFLYRITSKVTSDCLVDCLCLSYGDPNGLFAFTRFVITHGAPYQKRQSSN
jgi:hypothetical protein